MRVLLPKHRFGVWCNLEDFKAQIGRAKVGSVSSLIYSYLSIALPISFIFKKLPWYTTLKWFSAVGEKQRPNIKLPILDEHPPSKKEEIVSWDYDGRTWHFYSNLLASRYGWDLEYISNLTVEEALGKIQEILIDMQIDKEFQYSLSEVAYPYNKQTKKNEYKALERPYWMKPVLKKEVKKIKIHKMFVPQGIVEDSGGMEKWVKEN